MRNRLTIAALFASCLMISACTEDQRLQIKHKQSGLMGLDRVVTFYAPNGEVRTWEGRYKIELEGGMVNFIHEGKNVKLPSNLTVIEEK